MGNENAVTHGFFSKCLPERLADLHDQVKQMDPVNMAWDSLTLTYTVILDSLRTLLDTGDQKTRLVKKKRWEFGACNKGI